MKSKYFKLHVTSDDVTNFGKSYLISKYLIYSLCVLLVFFLFFSVFGIYSFFLSDSNTNSDLVLLNEDIKEIKFLKDPVNSKNNSDFETSFITSGFDDMHIGIDINGNIGTKIYSPMPGRVIYQGFDKKKGNSIIVSHDNGYITKYMHNKKNFVQSGDRVNSNKAIAEMGNSGFSVKNEGIHLHFELWKNGIAIDPAPFIKNLKLVDNIE